MDPALWAQFHPLEEALAAMGVVVWPMVELEADDALASAAHLAAARPARREGLHLDARQGPVAVRGRGPGRAGGSQERQDPRRRRACARSSAWRRSTSRTTSRWWAIPRTDIPGLAGYGPKTAARLIARHGALEDFPPEVLGERRKEALLFKTLATLVTDAPLFDDVEALRWRGPAPAFGPVAEKIGDARLTARVQALENALGPKNR